MKIGFYGATGSWDFGDYAMMVHNIQEIWEFAEDSEFYIFTPNKYITLQVLVDNLLDITKLKKIHLVSEPRFIMRRINAMADRVGFRFFKYHYFYAKEYKSFCNGDVTKIPVEFKEAIKQIDIMLFNGGGYLQHSWHVSNFIFATAIVYAHTCGKPVYFLGNSIGPMKKYDWVIRSAIHNVDKLMIRDGNNYTKKLLEKYGYKRYINGPDDLTFVNDVYQCESPYQNYVIIEVMAWITRAKKGYQYILVELLRLMDYIIVSGKSIVLITFDQTDKRSIECIDYLYSNAINKQNVYKCEKSLSMYKIFGLYRYCDFSVSFKYHPVVLAAGSNKPFIGVICDNDGYYEGKLNGVCENLNVMAKSYIIHIDNIREGTLINMYQQHIGKRVVDNDILEKLKQTRTKYIQKLLS